MKTPDIGAYYYHYKHTPADAENYAYQVIGIAHHTEMEDFDAGAMVVYRPLYKSAKVYQAGKHWDVRPLAMFMEDVTKEGKTFPRFSRITDPKIIAALDKVGERMYGEK